RRPLLDHDPLLLLDDCPLADLTPLVALLLVVPLVLLVALVGLGVRDRASVPSMLSRLRRIHRQGQGRGQEQDRPENLDERFLDVHGSTSWLILSARSSPRPAISARRFHLTLRSNGCANLVSYSSVVTYG